LFIFTKLKLLYPILFLLALTWLPAPDLLQATGGIAAFSTETVVRKTQEHGQIDKAKLTVTKKIKNRTRIKHTEIRFDIPPAVEFADKDDVYIAFGWPIFSEHFHTVHHFSLKGRAPPHASLG
jgi:hypothetical protein